MELQAPAYTWPSPGCWDIWQMSQQREDLYFSLLISLLLCFSIKCFFRTTRRQSTLNRKDRLIQEEVARIGKNQSPYTLPVGINNDFEK